MDRMNSQLISDHVESVTLLKGYRGTLYYRPQEQSPDAVAYVTLVHEFQSLDANQVPALKEQLEKAEATHDHNFQLRSYELLDSEGFGGVCRVPARL